MAQIYPLKIIVQFLLISDLYAKAFTNCTADCVNIRREWPNFDFEFYYDSNNTGYSINPTQVEYSIQTESSAYNSINSNTTPSRHLTDSLSLSPSFSSTTISSNDKTQNIPSIFPASPSQIYTSNLPLPNLDLSIQTTTVHTHIRPSEPNWNTSSTNCLDEISNYQLNVGPNQLNGSNIFLENYLLRTVFNSTNQTDAIHANSSISDFFKDSLTRIYEYGLDKQKQQLDTSYLKRRLLSTNQTAVNLTIWDFQIDNSSQTVDVIYYLRKDGILLPYKDASKIMSFVSNDLIRNITGLETVHKVQIYNVEPRSSKLVYNWINLPYFILIILILVICVIIIFLIFMKYRKEKQKWLDTINRELNRVIPTISSPVNQQSDNSPWTYESEQDDDDDSDMHSNNTVVRDVHKIDQSSQCDQSSTTDYTIRPLPKTPRTNNNDKQYKNERLIPINNILRKNSDYDRISYIKTQETIHETQKHPNILEIKLSHETQSIVKEIRKELNRYNFKKIIPDGNETSDA